MSGFKLLAIRPLMGCDRRFLKNLTEGEVYQFYNDYNFLNHQGKTIDLLDYVSSVEYKSTIPENLYDIKTLVGRDIQINISAIVGKNGSGKSAISELFLYCLFLISDNLGFVKKESFIDLNSLKNEDKIESERYNLDVKEIQNKLRCEFYYENNGSLYKLIINNGNLNLEISENEKNKFKFNIYKDVLEKTDLEPFFYSMVVNYSFYGFNTYQIGMWIKAFFHKNDGYQMPIVINPFRTKGNMDINSETYLTSSRLLANILSIRNYTNINSKSLISKIELYFDERKDYRTLENGEERFTQPFIQEFRALILKPLFDLSFHSEIEYPDIDTEIKRYAEIYLIHKLITIPTRYPAFSDFEKIKRKKESQDNYDLIKGNAKKYVYELYRDRSHITLKVRQTLNFLRENIFGIDDLKFNAKLDLNPLIKLIKNNVKKDWFTETVDYIPPPFLVSRIQFNDGSYFHELSSGEKQKISSLNSIIYHLKNIDSVHKNNYKNVINGIAEYDTINLIFDEIELYYHPEFQKNIISDLLTFIRRANYKYIKSINMLFLTHSPFILSDIPKQNILLLEIDSKTGKSKQIKKNNQTFGANIHDLLADNFFLNDTLIGKHADKKIINLINKIKDGKKNKEDIKLLNMIGDTFLKSSIKEFDKYDKDRN